MPDATTQLTKMSKMAQCSRAMRFGVLSRPRQHTLRDTTRDTRFDGDAISIACLYRVGNPLHLLRERFNGHESVRADNPAIYRQIPLYV
jgi:hypothetical protein